jgi:hypothetical protein
MGATFIPDPFTYDVKVFCTYCRTNSVVKVARLYPKSSVLLLPCPRCYMLGTLRAVD